MDFKVKRACLVFSLLVAILFVSVERVQAQTAGNSSAVSTNIVDQLLRLEDQRTVDINIALGTSRRDLNLKQRNSQKTQSASRVGKARPTASTGNSQLDALVDQYATLNNIANKANQIKAIIYCESKGDPNAKNRYSSAGGLAQYLDSTWANTPEGRMGQSKYDPNAAISAMTRQIAMFGTSPWNASRSCWYRY